MNRTIQLLNPAPAITQVEYDAFQTAYDFFNAQLFGGDLPPVLITLQRRAKAYGYLSPDRFVGRADSQAAAHELAMNPDHFGRTDEAILSTLVHEMAHVWQHAHGKPSRGSYHDKQWAAKMVEIGLHPSHTGEPGGRQTGAHVTHYIIDGGAYAQAYAQLMARGFALRWQSKPEDKTRSAKTASKTKYTCPDCEQNAWAKPDAALICGVCHEENGEIVYMDPA